MKGPLKEFIDFNPAERIAFGAMTRKIAMEHLSPNTRRVAGFTYERFKGGSKFKKNDVLMARITPCLENGKIAQVTILEDSEIAFGSTEFIVWRNKLGVTDSKFLYYLAISPEITDIAIKSMVGSSGRQRVQQGVLENHIVNLPELKKQRAIAATLSSLDDKIELNNRIIANLEAQTQAIFDEWLMAVDVDFPTGVLSDIAEVNPTRSLSKGQLATYIEMSNLSTSNSFPNNWVESTPFKGGMKFRNGDTVIARITPCLENGKTAYISCLDDGAVGFGSTEYVVLSAKDGYCNEMLYFLARNEDFRNYAIQNMNGSSGRQRVSGETIGNYEMAVPTKEASKQFEAIAKPIMGTIHNCAMQNRRLAQIRDTLLPKLMSGEIEVPEEGATEGGGTL